MAKHRKRPRKSAISNVYVEATSFKPNGNLQLCLRDIKTGELILQEYSNYEPTMALIMDAAARRRKRGK